MKRLKILFTLFCFLGLSLTAVAETVWYPLPKEAYQFGKIYPEAQKLLYAFDYGHALVYERLLLKKGAVSNPQKIEHEILSEIMKILKNPPNVKIDEGDIAPQYVYTFPLVINLFDWSHLLHQFVLDVLAVSEDRGSAMIARVKEIFAQYKANKPIAITDVCKTMMFMDGHYFSKAFRRTFPSFNLLIWSYHWFQIKLYEVLMRPTKAERDKGVSETITKFWELISDLPDSAEFDMMPETAKEAPIFIAAFPRLAPAFDNNHMLHDIISDILTSDKVLVSSFREEGMRMGRMDMDPNAFKSNVCPEDTAGGAHE